MVLDGTLIPIDRVAADRPFYSGKHRRHGMYLQVIVPAGHRQPDRGHPVGIRGAARRRARKKAEWIWGVLAELEAAGLIVLADKGYQGSTYAKLPYRGRNKPESQKMANRAHAKLRSPGERANAQLKTWHILRKLRCCPWRAGQLAKAIHVLQVREAKAAQCAIFIGEPMRADQPTQHCRRLHTVIGGVPPPSTKPLTTLQPSPTGDWARN